MNFFALYPESDFTILKCRFGPSRIYYEKDLSLLFNFYCSHAVADPGFPRRRGRQLSRWERQSIIWPIFF